jgi:hypothetical protein
VGSQTISPLHWAGLLSSAPSWDEKMDEIAMDVFLV